MVIGSFGLDLVNLSEFPLWFSVLFVAAVLWIVVLKFFSLWRCGRNRSPIWFVVIAVFNTMGFLPAIYLIWFDKSLKKGGKKKLRASRK